MLLLKKQVSKLSTIRSQLRVRSGNARWYSGSGEWRWVRVADREAQAFHAAHTHGHTRLGGYGMTLRAARPLQDHVVAQAVAHLQRKSPYLRLGIGLRGDELWFYESLDTPIDFKVLSGGGSLGEEVNKAWQEGLAGLSGPPWRMRLIQRGMDSSNSTLDSESATHPYVYDVFLSGHHGLEEGFNACFGLQNFVRLINDIIAGREINNDQYCQNLERDEILILEKDVRDKLQKDVRDKLQKDRHILERVKQTIPKTKSSLYLQKVFPRPSNTTPSTRHLTCTIDALTTKAFQKRCKENGVTFNSGFTAAVSAATVRLLQERGLHEDIYDIASSHAVHVARYLKPNPGSYRGGYGLQYSHTSRVDKNIESKFWEYCKVLNNELKEAFQSGLPLEQKMVKVMHNPDVTNAEQFANPPPFLHDFSITNLGSVTCDPRPGDAVLVSNVGSFNILHRFIHMNLHQIIKFKGCLSYNMSFAADYLTSHTAKLYLDTIVSIINEMGRCTENRR